MEAAIIYNLEKTGVELKYPKKPSDLVRKELKASGFIWDNKAKKWWSKISESSVSFVNKILENRKEIDFKSKTEVIHQFKSILGRKVRKKDAKAVYIQASKLLEEDKWENDFEISEIHRFTSLMLKEKGYGRQGKTFEIDNPLVMMNLEAWEGSFKFLNKDTNQSFKIGQLWPISISPIDDKKSKKKGLSGIEETTTIAWVPEDHGLEFNNEEITLPPENNGNGFSPRKVLPTMNNIKISESNSKKFNFKGEFGKFIGDVVMEPDSSIVAMIKAPSGTGKNHTAFQWMDDIASSGYPMLFGSYEEFVKSSLFLKKRDKYIKPEHQQLISAVDQKTVPTAEQFLEYAKHFPVILIDSKQEMPGEINLQHLREKFAGKLWLVINHANADGSFKGGTDPQHKADILIVGEKKADFRENYFHCSGKEGKNRYQSNQDLRYSPYQRKVLTQNNEENADTE